MTSAARLLIVTLGLVTSACVNQPSTAGNPPNGCHTESGWLDSSDGCSARAGYPDCYLVCPDKGTRRKL